jgi:hypothetical protein
MNSHPDSTHKHEQGMALFMAVFILTLVSMVALAGLQNSENESTAGGRSRAVQNMIYAADSGIEYAASRVARKNFTGFSLDLGNGLTVESRRRTESAPSALGDAGVGPPPDGYDVTAYSTSVFLVNVTATSSTGSVVELESKMGTLSDGGGGYR